MYSSQLSTTSVRHLIGINSMGNLLVRVSCIIFVNFFWKIKSHNIFYFLLYYRLFYSDGKTTYQTCVEDSPNTEFIREKVLKAISYSVEFVDAIFPVYKQQKRLGAKRQLLFSILKTWWSGLMKKLLIWRWMILVIPILCRSWWMILSVICIFTILMVLTHPREYI